MLLKLQAYKTYTYTGFSMTYKSVGKSRRLTLRSLIHLPFHVKVTL